MAMAKAENLLLPWSTQGAYMRLFIILLLISFGLGQPLFAVEVKSIEEINQENSLPAEAGEEPKKLDQPQVKSIGEINREKTLPVEAGEKPMEVDQSQVESINEINRENELRD